MLIMSYAIKFVKEKPKILLTNEQMFSIINSAANTFEAIEKEGDVMQGYDEALKLIFAYPSEEEMRAAQAVCCGRRCSACETPAAYAWRKRTVDMSLLLEKAMETELTATERETLKAFWFETMPVGAMARLKGISSAAVSDTLARAQEKLKKALRYAVLYQYDTLDEETVLPLAFAGARAVAAARNSRARETGERLRGLRTAQGLSRSALAAATGLAQGRVKAIEESKPVYARELALLSAFYGVTADSLICREEKGRGV